MRASNHRRLRARFERYLETENALAEASASSAERRANHAMLLGGLGIVASTALIVLFGMHMARSIAGPVRAVADGASRLAAGELSLRLPDAGQARSASSPGSSSWSTSRRLIVSNCAP